MENASKALLMAGGVLLTMMVVMLIIFAGGKISDYYNSKDELANVEKIADFNAQFTAYEGRDVSGYEIVSLANKVADYNMRYSNVAEAKNDERYAPITLKITIPQNKVSDLWYGDGNYTHLITARTIIQSSVKNEITNIISNEEATENIHGGSENTTRLVKNISTFDITEDSINSVKREVNNSNITDAQARKILEEKAENLYYQITKQTKSYNEIKSTLLGGNTGDIKKYYEYYQFKKGKFECDKIDSNRDYDTVSGRIKEIRFTYTGN